MLVHVYRSLLNMNRGYSKIMPDVIYYSIYMSKNIKTQLNVGIGLTFHLEK